MHVYKVTEKSKNGKLKEGVVFSENEIIGGVFQNQNEIFLVDYIHHVEREWESFCHSFIFLQNFSCDCGESLNCQCEDDCKRLAVTVHLDNFLSKVRLLYDFFHFKKAYVRNDFYLKKFERQDDDILAVHFLSSSQKAKEYIAQFEKICDKKICQSNTVKSIMDDGGYINKQLFHITYSRGENPLSFNKKRCLKDIFNAINDMRENFENFDSLKITCGLDEKCEEILQKALTEK